LSLVIKEEHNLRMPGNRVLRRTYRIKEEAAGDWRKYIIKIFIVFTLHQIPLE